MSALFVVGSTDLTHFITVPSYVVNEKDIYEEYADGNRKFRRKTIRTRITGSMSLLFSREEEYTDFIKLMKSSRDSSGAIRATVYVNNTLETKTSTFFVSFEVPNIKPLLGVKKVDALQVTIEEQ